MSKNAAEKFNYKISNFYLPHLGGFIYIKGALNDYSDR